MYYETYIILVKLQNLCSKHAIYYACMAHGMLCNTVYLQVLTIIVT